MAFDHHANDAGIPTCHLRGDIGTHVDLALVLLAGLRGKNRSSPAAKPAAASSLHAASTLAAS